MNIASKIAISISRNISKGRDSLYGKNLFLNPNFDTDLSEWTTSSHWIWDNGKAFHPASTTYLPLKQLRDDVMDVDKSYLVEFDVIVTTGNLKVQMQYFTGEIYSRSFANGTDERFSDVFTGFNALSFSRTSSGNSSSGWIDNVSVREVL